MITIISGEAPTGAGGQIALSAGAGGGGDGGGVRITAGETTDEASVGGDILLLAGEGSNPYSIDGGDGGACKTTTHVA
jgi:hypothetical protein